MLNTKYLGKHTIKKNKIITRVEVVKQGGHGSLLLLHELDLAHLCLQPPSAPVPGGRVAPTRHTAQQELEGLTEQVEQLVQGRHLGRVPETRLARQRRERHPLGVPHLKSKDRNYWVINERNEYSCCCFFGVFFCGRGRKIDIRFRKDTKGREKKGKTCIPLGGPHKV